MRDRRADARSPAIAAAVTAVESLFDLTKAARGPARDLTDLIGKLNEVSESQDALRVIASRLMPRPQAPSRDGVTFLQQLHDVSFENAEVAEAAFKLLSTIGSDRRYAEELAYATEAALRDRTRSESPLFTRLLVTMASDPQLPGGAMPPLCLAARGLNAESARSVLQPAIEADGWFFAQHALEAACRHPAVPGLAIERVRKPTAEIAALMLRWLDHVKDPFDAQVRAALVRARPSSEPVPLEVQADLGIIAFTRRQSNDGRNNTPLGVESVAGAVYYAARHMAVELGGGEVEGLTAPLARIARELINRYPDEAFKIAKLHCQSNWYVGDPIGLAYASILPPKAIFLLACETIPPRLSGDWPTDVTLKVLRRKASDLVQSPSRWHQLCLDGIETDPATLEPLKVAEAERVRKLARWLLPLDESEVTRSALTALIKSKHEDNRSAVVRMLHTTPNKLVADLRSEIIRSILVGPAETDVIVGCIGVIPDLPERENFRQALQAIKRGKGDREKAAANEALGRMKQPWWSPLKFW